MGDIMLFSSKRNAMTTLSEQISEAMKNLPVEETVVTPTKRQHVAATFVVVGRDVRNVAVSSTKAVAGATKKVTPRVVLFPVNVTKASKDLVSEVRVARQTKAVWKQHEAK